VWITKNSQSVQHLIQPGVLIISFGVSWRATEAKTADIAKHIAYFFKNTNTVVFIQNEKEIRH